MIRYKLKVKLESFYCKLCNTTLVECNLHCVFCQIPYEKRTYLTNSITETKVVNLQNEDYDILIGRTTKWGNKFKVKEFGRKKAIELYKEWIFKNQKLINSLPELKGKRLGCHCKPSMCHRDILVELVNKFCK